MKFITQRNIYIAIDRQAKEIVTSQGTLVCVKSYESKETVLNNINTAMCRNPRSKDTQAGNNAYIFACAYIVFGKDHSET